MSKAYSPYGFEGDRKPHHVLQSAAVANCFKQVIICFKQLWEKPRIDRK